MNVNLAFAENKDYSSVVVISIDALHPDAISEESCPNIYNFIKKGRYSADAKSTTPPKTLISHVAMLTGLSPEKNGKVDNIWKKGEARVSKPTMLTTAKKAGYETALIYSKPKLGYLANDYTDKEIYSRDDAIEKATAILNPAEKQFIFLHISGLDFVGPESGWLSPEYMEEFNFIDEQLADFFNKISASPTYLMVITSDHAGHAKIHGSDHPDDFKRPLIVYSSVKALPEIPDSALLPDKFKTFIERLYLD
ncbi:alkaline phosphatase family protein [Deferribacteres bacterium DY0609]